MAKHLVSSPAVRATNLSLGLLALLALSGCGDQAPSETPTSSSPSPSAGASSASQSGTAAVSPTNERIQSPAEIFWTSLKTLCDQRFGGQLTIGTEESDRDFGYADVRMHAKRCRGKEIDINVLVDEDHSRTWMLRKTDEGFSLHHEHLGENGKPDETSGYGGFTASAGTAIRQEFPADENTGKMIPAAATNVWAVEVEPGKQFAYELQRIEEQRMFRLVFDLSKPLSAN